MPTNNRPHRGFIANWAGPRAVRAATRRALAELGYELLDAAALRPESRPKSEAPSALVHLIDARRRTSAPDPNSDPETPVIALCGARPAALEDARVIGYAKRPAELDDLYPLIQRALEATPRSAPRIRTLLSARCIRRDRRWVGSVTSLSEGGCLFRGSQAPARGAQMNIQLALPRAGIVSARAICVRRERDRSGLAFDAPPKQVRHSIGEFVSECLATG